MANYKIIFNPTAGRGTAKNKISEIEELLSAYGIEFDMEFTDKRGQAIGMAKEAAEAGYEVVVAAGGDGTVNEVLNGLMEAKKNGADKARMGVIAIGTGNDFAYGAHIPPGVEDGCKTLADNHRHIIDVGHVVGGDFPEGRYFGNCIGVGFDAVGGFVAAKLHPLRGFFNYLVAVILTVFYYFKAPTLEIEYDDEKITKPFMMCSIMNGTRLGGGFYMAPNAITNDGKFDLCIVEDAGRLRILTLVPYFFNGTQESQKEIQIVQGSRVNVTAVEGVLPAHVDGETLCEEGHRVEVTLLPKTLEVVCQAQEKTQEA
jgi:YegS/Rv2252/BmrU family lipid kinase